MVPITTSSQGGKKERKKKKTCYTLQFFLPQFWTFQIHKTWEFSVLHMMLLWVFTLTLMWNVMSSWTATTSETCMSISSRLHMMLEIQDIFGSPIHTRHEQVVYDISTFFSTVSWYTGMLCMAQAEETVNWSSSVLLSQAIICINWNVFCDILSMHSSPECHFSLII